jgi:hypothetical protein
VLTQYPSLLHPASGISGNSGLEALAVQFPEFRNPELIERRKCRTGQFIQDAALAEFAASSGGAGFSNTTARLVVANTRSPHASSVSPATAASRASGRGE